MPRRTANPDALREEWHGIYGDVIEWLESYVASFDGIGTDDTRQASDLWQMYERAGILSDSSTRILLELHERLVQSQAPAGRDDAPWVPNGTYRLRRAYSGTEFVYQVYLVLRGSLAGQRIIKFQRSDSDRFRSGFEGFAFLTRDGGMRVWRRFAGDVNEPYVQLFGRALAASLIDMGAARDAIDGTELVVEFDDSSYFLSVERRCAVCNSVLDSHRRHGGFCEAHRHQSTSVHSVDHSLGLSDLAEASRAAARGMRQMAVSVEGANGHEAMPRRRRPLPMCELGTGEVQ